MNTAYVIIICEGKILFLNRNQERVVNLQNNTLNSVLEYGMLELPGGTAVPIVERDLAYTARREVKEETDISLNGIQPVGNFNKRFSTSAFYVDYRDEFTSVSLSHEHFGARWLDLWDLLAISLASSRIQHYQNEPSERTRRVLPLHADVAIHTLLTTHAAYYLTELNQHSAEILQMLARAAGREVSSDELVSYLTNESTWPGMDGDFRISGQEQKMPIFSYGGSTH